MPHTVAESPFFQVQTDSFALFAVDTGVAGRSTRADGLALALHCARQPGARRRWRSWATRYMPGRITPSADNPDFADLALLNRARRRDRHGWRHPRPGALCRAYGRLAEDDPSLRQWRGRGLPELRNGARLAHPPSDRRVGVLSGPGPVVGRSKRRRRSGNSPRGGGRGDRTPGPSRPSGCRQRSMPTWPRFTRASSRSASSPRRASSVFCRTASTGRPLGRPGYLQ